MDIFMNPWILQPLCMFVCIGLGSLSGVVSNMGDLSWYNTLRKPPYSPPSWIFGVVWTILYALMGLAFANVLPTGNTLWNVLFAVQLAVNLLWSPLFFRFHLLDISFWTIIVMWWLVLAVTLGAYPVPYNFFGIAEFPTAYLLVPYLGWITFAGTLAGAVYSLNTTATNK